VPSSRTENTRLLFEVINLAYYGDENPWNLDYDDDVYNTMDYAFEAQSQSAAGARAICKFDRHARDELLAGSEQKVHVASLTIGGDTYDFYGTTTDGHYEDELEAFFTSLDDVAEADDIEQARKFNPHNLPEDFTVEVYKNLPRDGHILRHIGALGLQFAAITDDVAIQALAEGSQVTANDNDTMRALEIDLQASTIGGDLASTLAQTLREDFTPVFRGDIQAFEEGSR
jgi:hypothetical protein